MHKNGSIFLNSVITDNLQNISYKQRESQIDIKEILSKFKLHKYSVMNRIMLLGRKGLLFVLKRIDLSRQFLSRQEILQIIGSRWINMVLR